MAWRQQYQTDEQLRRENRRLQEEIDYQRYEREREQEQRERDAERRQREYREARQEELHSATTWPEALRKNRYLMERERNECWAADDEPEDYRRDMLTLRANWDRALAEIDRAAEIWREEQRAIDEAVRQMRGRVAERLRGEFERSELADYIANDEIDGWMNW